MARVEAAIKNANTSVLLLSHLRKMPSGAKPPPPSMDDLAGGAVYQRAARTILLLSRKKHYEALPIKVDGHGVRSMDTNCTMTVLKARNGHGMFMRIAFDFQRESWTFRELGIVADGETAAAEPAARPVRKTHEEREAEADEVFSSPRHP